MRPTPNSANPTNPKNLEKTAEIRRRLYPQGQGAVETDLEARLLRFIEREGDVLPAAESALGQLGRQLYRDEVALDRCIDIIATDASLTHLVLRAANIAALGSRKFTIPYAVMFLGLARLRVLFGVEVLRRMNGDRLSADWVPFWERSLFSARLLERLASYYHPIDGTEYLAGLLHDASWPTVVTFFRKEYSIFFDRADALFPLEKTLFGTSHAAISAAMCVRSGLPVHVVEAIARHHDAALPERATITNLRYNGPFLGVLLQLTDDIADACGFPSDRPAGSDDGKTMDDVLASPRVAWINAFGWHPDLNTMAQDELLQVRKVGLLLQAS
ncbi:HD-like signal output (HDOD) domain, no enzymatic activity [Verrucomicrobium sp. GAS474]|uniref:HDOD domain-containing protein n=1 Tax=Verrucomicrobium sp. GAS474 TaxID=1882831 RepID=UPI00087D8CD6|nr:HDOD domain-containing protein [Verrucomicrobium sp. GAS474]SDT90050.1 HD-like signal output (HDOD) domain, no enzymatic activity [Verrucomicrobium sp. GAS474]